MTRALFLAEPGAFAGLAAGGAVTLGGAEGRHAGAVRRIRAGEVIDVGDGSGTVATCRVTAAAKDGLQLVIQALITWPEPLVRMTLVQALAKGGRDEQAAETATEAGVDAVIPWQASRCVVRWEGERGEKARHRWESVVREASKQSRRPRVPVIEPLRTTPCLAKRIAEADLSLVLHESATSSLMSAEVPAAGEVLVIVGPEGGITDDEIELLAAAGAQAVRLGPEVLRASTAGPLALAYLASCIGRWS